MKQTEKLIELIKEHKSLKEIMMELNLSHKQVYNLFRIIANKGYEYSRKYFESGDIKYLLKTNLLNDESDDIDITTDYNVNKITVIVTSDLHIGSIHQRIDLLNKIYEYCA